MPMQIANLGQQELRHDITHEPSCPSKQLCTSSRRPFRYHVICQSRRDSSNFRLWVSPPNITLDPFHLLLHLFRTNNYDSSQPCLPQLCLQRLTPLKLVQIAHLSRHNLHLNPLQSFHQGKSLADPSPCRLGPTPHSASERGARHHRCARSENHLHPKSSDSRCPFSTQGAPFLTTCASDHYVSCKYFQPNIAERTSLPWS